jgi:hypothetical protein
LSIGFQRPRVAGADGRTAPRSKVGTKSSSSCTSGEPIDAKQTSADGATPRDVALAEGNPETAALIDRLLAE